MARPKKVSLAKVGKPIAKGEPHPPTAPKTEKPVEKQPEEETKRTAEREARVAQAAKEDAARTAAKAEEAEESAKKQAVAAEEAKAWAIPTTMSLGDVHAILADTYPGYEPRAPMAKASGMIITLPGEKTITVERKRVKACANMEELRAYIDSVK